VAVRFVRLWNWWFCGVGKARNRDDDTKKALGVLVTPRLAALLA
jgi:hypothetical protein